MNFFHRKSNPDKVTKKLQEQLVLEAKNGNLDAVKGILANPQVKINAAAYIRRGKGTKGCSSVISPLVIALIQGNTDVAMYLINKNCEIEPTKNASKSIPSFPFYDTEYYDETYSALGLAVETNAKPELLKILLKKSIDLNPTCTIKDESSVPSIPRKIETHDLISYISDHRLDPGMPLIASLLFHECLLRNDKTSMKRLLTINPKFVCDENSIHNYLDQRQLQQSEVDAANLAIDYLVTKYRMNSEAGDNIKQQIEAAKAPNDNNNVTELPRMTR